MVPPTVHDVLRAPGQPLDTGTRSFMEPRFGHDFSQVRVHTDARAAESARAVNALAYTVGKDVVFGKGHYMPGTSEGKRLLAHELTHVVQQKAPIVQRAEHIASANDASEQEAEHIADMVGTATNVSQSISGNSASVSPNTIFFYRDRSAFNFGRLDTPTLHEDVFRDPRTQPWIEQIEVKFDGTKLDSDGNLIPTGSLLATYASNAAAELPISMSVTGGSTAIGLTTQGNFTVKRIEGVGYNDLPFTGSDGEGPRKKYSKSLNSSMHYAVFFHRGEAIHLGNLNLGSHACVHAGDDAAAVGHMRQINYHSVIGRTKVSVSYDTTKLKELCCSRLGILGITRKGVAINPCNTQDPATCTT